ncbi:unnamed protein product, partial [Prorocentrum cordatum]
GGQVPGLPGHVAGRQQQAGGPDARAAASGIGSQLLQLQGLRGGARGRARGHAGAHGELAASPGQWPGAGGDGQAGAAGRQAGRGPAFRGE